MYCLTPGGSCPKPDLAWPPLLLGSRAAEQDWLHDKKEHPRSWANIWHIAHLLKMPLYRHLDNC